MPDTRPLVLVIGLVVATSLMIPVAAPVDGAARAQELPGPQFDVFAVAAPAEATTGASITITARVRNTGSSTGTVKLQYRFANETRVSKSRTLNAGGSAEVSYTVTVPDVPAGTYSHGVFIEGGDRGRAVGIRVQRPAPRIRVSEFTGPSQATSGDQVTVRATAVNTGTRAERTTIEYRMGSRVLASETLDLAGGESRTVFLSAAVPDLPPETYTQGVFEAGTDNGQTARLVLSDASRFAVTELDAPGAATVGDTVVVAATVTNVGTGQGSAAVQYRIGGSVVGTHSVTLVAGESRRVAVSATVPALAAGAYTQGVFVGETSQGQTTSLSVQGSPRFEVASFTAPATARAGDDVRVAVTLENTGTGPGTASVVYLLDGETVATTDVTLRAGERVSVPVSVTTDDLEPGDHTLGVAIQGTEQRSVSTLTVVRTDTPTPRVVTRTVEAPPETASPGMPGFGVAIAVLALLAGTLTARRV